MRSISTRAPLVLLAAGSMILLGGGVASACVTAHPGADQSPTVSKTDKPGDKTQGDKVVTDKTDKPAVKQDCNCHAKPIVVKKKDCKKPVVVVVHKKDCKKPVEHKKP